MDTLIFDSVFTTEYYCSSLLWLWLPPVLVMAAVIGFYIFIKIMAKRGETLEIDENGNIIKDKD